MISLINCRKCKLINSDGNHIRHYPRVRPEGRQGASEQHKGILRLRMLLNCSVGFTGATICQNLHNCTLQVSVPYINFI